MAACFLARLRRDVRGNVLALFAASIIPLIALVGGSIDLSRLYLSKVRLQHACDAGALAGRKAMGGGVWTQTSPAPEGTADQFFAGNFATGAYATTDLTHKYTESAGKVTGNASVKVPMTLMAFFKMPARTLTVTCSAQMQIPNTDVMFVLDTTGSMACAPSVSGNCAVTSTSKITTLKYAVKCFYESVTQLTTDAGCPTGTSTGKGINSSAQVRFGFVPYSTNVNVGRLLQTSWVADSWPYQSRISRVWVRQGSPTVVGPKKIASDNRGTESTCNQENLDKYGQQYSGYTRPADTDVTSSDNKTRTKTVYTNSFDYNKSTKYCTSYETKTTTVYTMTEGVTPGTNDMFDSWRYAKISQTISGLKNSTTWNTGFSLPLGASGAARTISWAGCIEERATTYAASYDPIPSGAQDLDIDTAPSGASTTGSYWAPALPAIVYPRQSGGAWDMAEVTTTDDYPDATTSGYVSSSCPIAATKLKTWDTATAFDNYVDSLVPAGNTYHDIGLLWGGRLMSPTGLFKSENATTSTGGAIQRYMIFLTDGDTSTSPQDYAAYGLPWFDRRQQSSSSTPTNTSAPTTAFLNGQVNQRFAALCTAVKNKGINLYVVSFGGSGIADDTKTRLKTCATDKNHFYDATSTDDLKSAFSSIAAQITQLRLVQ